MTNQENNNISPDGKWQVTIINGKLEWVDLTKIQGQYTIKEIVEATKNILPEIFKIDHIHPNPFNTNTSIQFRQFINTKINLHIYDINGKLIKKLIDNKLYHRGFHDVNWNASSYASGIYIIKLFSKNKILTHKIILIK